MLNEARKAIFSISQVKVDNSDRLCCLQYRTTTATQTSSQTQWTRQYAKAAKGKPKGKGASDKPVVKKLRLSRADARKRSVILTQTIPGVGEIGEELKVTRGFARNYLFPNHFAKLSSDELRAHYADNLAVRPHACLQLPTLLILES